MRTITVLVLSGLLLGCSHSRTYQVSVTNQTDQPITFGLVKQGEPFEQKWASPEDAAIYGGKASAETWAAIPPGKTATSEQLKGRFRNDAEAYLRVYEGKLDLPGILSISRGQPNRLDLLLTPGYNKFVIIDEDGHFIAHRDENAQPPKPVKQ
jgi:hypothetical protein